MSAVAGKRSLPMLTHSSPGQFEIRISRFLENGTADIEAVHSIFSDSGEMIHHVDASLIKRFYERIAYVCLDYKLLPSILEYDNCQKDRLFTAVVDVHLKERRLLGTIRTFTQASIDEDDPPFQEESICSKIITVFVLKEFSKELDSVAHMVFESDQEALASALFALELPEKFCKLMYERKRMFDDESGLTDLFFMRYVKPLLNSYPHLQNHQEHVLELCNNLSQNPAWQAFSESVCERGKEAFS